MEKMYQDYKDVAEFRMVYIREAHASDSDRPVRYATEKGIKQQTHYEDRCVTAQMLLDEKKLTMPFLIDGMDNKTNEAYAAQPDRVFVVGVDGKLVVAAERGPWGFKPGVEKAKDWLVKFKKENATKAKADSKPDSKPAEKQDTAKKDAQ